MTEINLDCPGCSSALLVSEEFFGKIIRCPSCKKKLEIPQMKVSVSSIRTETRRLLKSAGKMKNTATCSLKKLKLDVMKKVEQQQAEEKSSLESGKVDKLSEKRKFFIKKTRTPIKINL